MAKTLGEIKAKIWQEMEQNSDSVTYSSQRLTDMVNEVSQELLEGKVSNELTGKYIQGNILDFNKGKFACNIVDSVALTTDITPASIIIETDTTNLPTVGAVLLGDEVIEYTGKTATELTGVTGILSNHTAGEMITPIYVAPVDFWKSTKVYSMTNRLESEILEKDPNNQLKIYYQVMKGATASYMYFYGVDTRKTYYTEYTKSYTALALDADECIFPDFYSMSVIPFIAGGRMIKDEILRLKLLTQGYNKLATEFVKAGEQTGKPKNIQRKRYNFSSIS